MNRRSVAWILFATLVLVAPLPFFLVETGRVPLARLLQLSAYTVALIVVEGGQGAVTMAAAILIAQVFAYALLLYVVAGALARVVQRLAPHRAGIVTAAVVVACVVGASSFDVYRTPFSTTALRASLLGVFR